MTDTATKERLKSYIERIERLNEEKQAIADDIKEVFSEAKSMGFDVKAMREVIKLRKMDSDARAEMESLVDLYSDTVGL